MIYSITYISLCNVKYWDIFNIFNEFRLFRKIISSLKYREESMTKVHVRRISTSIAATLMMLPSSQLLAWEGLDKVREGAFTLEEVIVSARRRKENLQKTPIAISAFTTQSLEDSQIVSATDLARVTPNLTFDSYGSASGNSASSQVFIRGIGQTDFQALTDPGVGMYIDGVYHARTVGSAIDFIDVERIEILKGPQGTLFGRNTIGGAISIISRKPGDEFEGAGKVTVGSANRVDTSLNVNIPIAEGLAMRVSGGSRNRDGYVTRLVDGEKVGDDNARNIRARVLWTPSEELEIDINADYTREDEKGTPTVFAGIGTGPKNAFGRIASAKAGCTLLLPGGAGVAEGNDPNCANNQWNAGPFATNGTFPLESKLRTWGVAGTVTYDLGNISLKSITSYRFLEASGARDADNTPLKIVHTTFVTKDKQFSQEFQLAGTSFDGRLKWVGGLYYFDQNAEDTAGIFLPVGDINLGGPVEITSKAAFAQATYGITEKLNITLGLRYTDERKKYTPDSFTLTTYAYPGNIDGSFNSGGSRESLLPADAIVAGALVILRPNTPFLPKVQQQNNANKFTPMVNIAYDVSDDIMVYGTYSQGFKGGGFSTRIVELFPSSPSFKPEFATSYEVGFKSDIFDGMVRLNGSAFYTDYTNMQFVVRPTVAPVVFNAGKARIQGFELEWTIIPTEHLIITGGLGHINGKYLQLDNIVRNSGVTLNNQFQQSPRWSFNTGVAYSIPINDDVTVTPRFDYSYRSKNYVDSVNTEVLAQNGYSLLNAGVAIDAKDDRVRVIFAVKNVTNKTYKVAGFSALRGAGSYAESVYARPREWSLSFQYKF